MQIAVLVQMGGTVQKAVIRMIAAVVQMTMVDGQKAACR